MARKMRSGGSTNKFSFDKSKKYKYNTSGSLVEFSGDAGDDDITISGSKSSIRRMGDLERNVSILAAKLLTNDGESGDSDDSSFGRIETKKIRFKNNIRMDDPLDMRDKIDMNNNKITDVATPTSGQDATNKTYVDTKVAGIVDSAPAALDTLNELAAALGDDANFSTTLSTQIGTKVTKAGDTMTGALTLSGAPSSANHAATKAYVDSAVSGGTGVLDTDDIAEAGNLYFTNTRVDARIPTNVSSFANDSGYLTSVGTINYNDLSNKPTIPTNNNQLTNGAGYVTTNTTYTAGNGLTLSGTEFLMSGNYTGSFTASGDVTAYSDERLKSDITTIEDALNKVKNLRGVMFDKTDTLSSELKRSTGVIAQEVEKVLPEVVHNDINTGYKSVAYGNIVGVLIEAIKEQQEQIDKLKHDIEFLKGIR